MSRDKRWECPKYGALNHRTSFCCMGARCDYERVLESSAPPSDAEMIDHLVKALRPLSAIADAYDDNALDDGARKRWGLRDEFENTTPPEQIELYSGRGGKRLLTLADCFEARSIISKVKRRS